MPTKPINWENFRDADSNLKLYDIYKELYGYSAVAQRYIDNINTLRCIKSRQAAADIIVTAAFLSGDLK